MSAALRSPRTLAIAALAALAVAFAWPMQVNGFNQTAHYALVKALSRGTATIDQTRGEVGDLSTGDVALFKGHYYAVKAPGLAFVSVPAYVVIDAIGMRTTGDPTRAIWVLNLFGSVLPALVLVATMWWLADRLEPGFGLAAALALGLATLVLPFATLYFAHTLPAALGFGAFAFAWSSRRGPPRPVILGAAGVSVGLAVVADYSYALLAVFIGLYLLRRDGLVRRGATYAVAVVAGTLPLLAFNLWAFGSITHTPYDDYWEQQGREPSWELLLRGDGFANARDFLFSTMGLFVLTPAVLAGAAGLVLLYRRGARAEALAAGAIAAFYLVYHAGTGGFGGLGPPRYLMVVVPFLMLGFASAARAFPLASSVLALVSAVQLVLMTATGPLAAYDGDWLERAEAREFAQTAASLVDVTGWYTIAPFFLAAALVVLAAIVSVDARADTRDVAVAAVVLVGWVVVALFAHNPNGEPLSARDLAVVVGTTLLALAAGVLVRLAVARIAPVTVRDAPAT